MGVRVLRTRTLTTCVPSRLVARSTASTTPPSCLSTVDLSRLTARRAPSPNSVVVTVLPTRTSLGATRVPTATTPESSSVS